MATILEKSVTYWRHIPYIAKVNVACMCNNSRYLALIQIFNYRWQYTLLNQPKRFPAPTPGFRIASATGFVAAQIYGGIIERASYMRLTMVSSKSNRFLSGQPRRRYRRCQQRRRIGSRFAIGHEVSLDLHDS